MIISLIAAIGKNRQLGVNNKIPWNVKEDIKNFKKLTFGHHILMGRKTFQSIGKALPGRVNIVITRNNKFEYKNCLVFDCSYKAIEFAEKNGETELFIIGGASIYDFFLKNNLANKIYLTEVNYDGNADTFFPKFKKEEWKILEQKEFSKQEEDNCSGKFVIMKKK